MGSSKCGPELSGADELTMGSFVTSTVNQIVEKCRTDSKLLPEIAFRFMHSFGVPRA